MKTPNVVLGIALLATTGLITATIHAAEPRDAAASGSRTGGDRDAVAPLVQHASDKPTHPHVAEGGADRLKERQLASDGSDRLKQNRVADGGYDSGSDMNADFCFACR
ncbi:hypothetical protein DJ564_18695 [Pseudomonas sp. 31-12]|uniref:hypothetical protein n=1 Tax=Pseudomonas sp. 31-12 TaxID=2201356 RepID=UPI000D6CD817|nr:hypothetical protein [Pseudomonas sp. 31-12]AWM92694.1 hypothetical protein DJ564_18695 [Pseudomonas sp. 31-12]